jgi:hypothetical protein
MKIRWWRKQIITHASITLALALIFFQIANPLLAAAQSSDSPTATPPALMISKCVTWWSHDATGYHPAIYLQYENDSGHDLSGQLIRFQCRFTDIRNGYVTVARKEMRTALANTRSQRVILRGPTPFELPIDENGWPNIECKAMSRIGEVGDEGTQDLILCRLESITLSDDEALERLEKQDDMRKGKYIAQPSQKGRNNQPEKPLTASTPLLRLTDPPEKSPGKGDKKPPGKGASIDFSIPAKGPGLGDDFFDFEQAFGRPAEVDPTSGRWTWVHYKEPDNSDIFVGARHPNSKADVVVASVHSNKALTDSQVNSIAHVYAGKYKAQPLGSPNHSVRYLASGRVQVTTMASSTYHLSVYNIGDAKDGNYVLILSRIPGTVEGTLTEQVRTSHLLNFLKPVLGDAQN